MHNLVYLIGRLTENPEKKSYDDKDMLTINLAVQRSFKNEDGIYEVDYIRCVLWNAIATNTSEYCKKGDLVGIWSQHMQYKEIYCILPLIYM